MKGLSAIANATILAQASAVAGPYLALASHLATALAGVKSHAETVKAEKVTVWDSFKSAITVARDNGHDSATMRAGLEIACLQAAIPAGSFRGYMSTVESLAADLFRGELSLIEVNEISVKDARERYMDADKKALNAARAKLNEVTKGWTAEQLLLLADIAADSVKQDAPEQETEQPKVANG